MTCWHKWFYKKEKGSKKGSKKKEKEKKVI
jgi:hypothetical protein